MLSLLQDKDNIMPTQEFIYTIDQKLSQELKTLVIKISDISLEEHTLLRFASAKERTVIQSLIEEEKTFRLKENNNIRLEHHRPFAFFRLRPGKSFELLKQLAATSKLFFEKKRVACDFFSRLGMQFIVDEKDEQIALSALFKDKNNEYKPSTCDLVIPGSPHIVVTGIILRFVHENIAWQEIQPHLQEKVLLLSPQEFKAWQKELYSDDEYAHEIIFQKKPELGNNEQHVLPVLFLKDKQGAFADLFMDYKGKVIPIAQQNIGPKDEIIRNTQAETVFEKDLIESGFEKRYMTNSNYFCPLDKVHESLDFLLDVGWKIIDFQGRDVKRLCKLSMQATLQDDIIKLEGKAQFDNEEVEAHSLILALQRKESFLALKDNAIGLLFKKSKELLPLVDLINDVTVCTTHAQLKKNRLGLIQPFLQQELGNLSLQPLDSATTRFQGALRPYQQKGVEWLTFLYNNNVHGILADDMGLGKTVQTISFLSRLPPSCRSLIVMPTSLLFNWKSELETFFPTAKVLVYHGLERKKEELENAAFTIILTSYGLLRQDIEAFEKISFTCVFLDEAQNIKNLDAKTTQAALRLQADFRLSITGTPLENSILELFTQFQFLMPDLITEDEGFDPSTFAKLKKKIAPFILRRKKEEVAKDLPEKIEQQVFVEMRDDQRLLYDETLASFKNGLLQKSAQDGGKNHTMEILEAILRLRQICSHPDLVPELTQKKEISSAKFDLVIEDLKTIRAEKKKVIVFSQFTSMLALFCKECQNLGWNYLLLDGKTQNRKEIVDLFQNEEQESLLFMSLKAGGVGLNLTKADYVFIYDPWWNEAVEAQAIARAHRIGRKDTVFSKRYVMKDSIEENILKLKSAKKEIADFLFDDTSSIASLSIDELTQLLS
jgi:SNF2 family DNA or RNA helicase